MSQVQAYTGQDIYSLFGFSLVSKIKSDFPGLEEEVRTACKVQISRDGIALKQSPSVVHYQALESRIVNSIGSAQYGSAAINEVAGKYADAMDYIKYLAENPESDKTKAENLKVALIKSLIKRIPDRAKDYIAEPENGLYERAVRELADESRGNPGRPMNPE